MKTERRFQIVCVQLNNVLLKQIDDIEILKAIDTSRRRALEKLDALRQQKRDKAEMLQQQQQALRRQHQPE